MAFVDPVQSAHPDPPRREDRQTRRSERQVVRWSGRPHDWVPPRLLSGERGGTSAPPWRDGRCGERTLHWSRRGHGRRRGTGVCAVRRCWTRCMYQAHDSRPPAPPRQGQVGVRLSWVLTAGDGNQFSAAYAAPVATAQVGVVVPPDVRGLHPYYVTSSCAWRRRCDARARMSTTVSTRVRRTPSSTVRSGCGRMRVRTPGGTFSRSPTGSPPASTAELKEIGDDGRYFYRLTLRMSIPVAVPAQTAYGSIPCPPRF